MVQAAVAVVAGRTHAILALAILGAILGSSAEVAAGRGDLAALAQAGISNAGTTRARARAASTQRLPGAAAEEVVEEEVLTTQTRCRLAHPALAVAEWARWLPAECRTIVP